MSLKDNVYIRIKAESKAALAKLGAVTKKLTSLKGLIVAGLGMIGLKKSFDAVTEAAGVQEDAINDLANSLSKINELTKENMDALQNQATALQQVTKFGDEQIIGMMSELATFGMNTKQIQENTMAVLDLAAAKKMQLLPAATMLGMAFQGEVTRLKRYGLTIDSTIEKSERFAAVQDAINKRFGGRALTQATTFTGIIQQMKNAFGDLLETLGFYLTKNETFLKAIRAMQKTFEVAILWLDRKAQREKEATKAMSKHTKGMRIQQTETRGLIDLISELADEYIDLADARDLASKEDKTFEDLSTAVAIAQRQLNRFIEHSGRTVSTVLGVIRDETGKVLEDQVEFVKKYGTDREREALRLITNLLNIEKEFNRQREEALLKSLEGDKIAALDSAWDTMLQKAKIIKGGEAEREQTQQEYAARRLTNTANFIKSVQERRDKARVKYEEGEIEKGRIAGDRLSRTADRIKAGLDEELRLAQEAARAKIEITIDELQTINSLREGMRNAERDRQRAVLADENVNVQDKKDIIFDLNAEIERMNKTISGDELSPIQIETFIKKYREIADISKSFDDDALQDAVSEGLDNLNKQIVDFPVEALKLEIDELSSLEKVTETAGKMYFAMKDEIERLARQNPPVIDVKTRVTGDITDGSAG
jgi:hypothetical protein